MRSVPRASRTSTLPCSVVESNWNCARSTKLSAPMASTVPSRRPMAAALAGPVTMRSLACTGPPRMAALRTSPRTTVTSPCTVLKVPWRLSPLGLASGAAAGAAEAGAAGAVAWACAVSAAASISRPRAARRPDR